MASFRYRRMEEALIERDLGIMSDLNRGIMKFDGADKPILVTISAVIVLGSIAALIIWALRVAYVVG